MLALLRHGSMNGFRAFCSAEPFRSSTISLFGTRLCCDDFAHPWLRGPGYKAGFGHAFFAAFAIVFFMHFILWMLCRTPAARECSSTPTTKAPPTMRTLEDIEIGLTLTPKEKLERLLWQKERELNEANGRLKMAGQRFRKQGVIISEDTELPPAMLVACEAAMLSQFAPQTERKPGTSLMVAFLAIGAASYAVVPAGSANVMFIELLGALGQIGAGSELQQVMASLTRSPSCKRGRWIFALVFPAFLCCPLGFLLSCSCH